MEQPWLKNIPKWKMASTLQKTHLDGHKKVVSAQLGWNNAGTGPEQSMEQNSCVHTHTHAQVNEEELDSTKNKTLF
jgi:hypothetical protein